MCAYEEIFAFIASYDVAVSLSFCLYQTENIIIVTIRYMFILGLASMATFSSMLSFFHSCYFIQIIFS